MIKKVVNRWPEIFEQFDKLNQMYVAIGFFSDDEDAQLLTIVRANEYGAHIKPIHGEWLTIPTKDTPLGSDGGPMPARQIPNLFRPKGKSILAVPDGDSLKVMYFLVKEVNIPARPFIRTAMDDNRDKYKGLMLQGINAIIGGRKTAKQVLEILGNTAVSDIRKQMVKWSDPPNAGATVERKGTNNPLVDKGILSRAVTYKVLEGWHE